MKKDRLVSRVEDGKHSLKYNLDVEDAVDTRVYDMSTTGKLPHMFPCHMEEDGGARIFTYKIGDKAPVQEFLKKEVNKPQMLTLLYNLLAGLEDFGLNMVSLSYVAKDVQYIYVTPENQEVSFVVVPVNKETTDLNEVRQLVKDIIAGARYFEMDRDNYVAKLISFLNRPGTFSLGDMKKYVEQMLLEIGIDIAAINKNKQEQIKAAEKANADAGKVSRLGVMMNNARMNENVQAPMPQNQNRPVQNGPVNFGQPAPMPQGQPGFGQAPMPGFGQFGQPAPMPQNQNRPVNFGQPATMPQGQPAPMPQGQPGFGQAPMPGFGQFGQAPMPDFSHFGQPAPGFNNFGQAPEEPSMPEAPKAPEMPPIPEAPKVPEMPPIPEAPKAPEMPPMPEFDDDQKTISADDLEDLINIPTPKSPEVPPVPEAPKAPEVPSVPEAPKAPEMPPIPEAPKAPEMPPMPEAPKVPEMPPIPEAPKAPEMPPMPEAPKAPDVPPMQNNGFPPFGVFMQGNNGFASGVASNMPPVSEAPVPPMPSMPVAPQTPAMPAMPEPPQVTEMPQEPQMPHAEGLPKRPQMNEEEISVSDIPSMPERPVPYLVRKKTGEKIYIDKDEFVIGKSANHADYTIRDNTAVSRAHCIISRRNGVCYIRDNNSTNGTFINDQELDRGGERFLTNNVTVKLGDEEFVFFIR